MGERVPHPDDKAVAIEQEGFGIIGYWADIADREPHTLGYLFAAAPELLKCSKELVANLTEAEEHLDYEGEEFADIKRLREVIARVEGIDAVLESQVVASERKSELWKIEQPKTDKDGHLNHLKMLHNLVKHGQVEEADLMLCDIIDTLSAERVKFSYGGSTTTQSKKRQARDVANYAMQNPSMVD